MDEEDRQLLPPASPRGGRCPPSVPPWPSWPASRRRSEPSWGSPWPCCWAVWPTWPSSPGAPASLWTRTHTTPRRQGQRGHKEDRMMATFPTMCPRWRKKYIHDLQIFTINSVACVRCVLQNGSLFPFSWTTKCSVSNLIRDWRPGEHFQRTIFTWCELVTWPRRSTPFMNKAKKLLTWRSIWTCLKNHLMWVKTL